jgi:hypothetical protein
MFDEPEDFLVEFAMQKVSECFPHCFSGKWPIST